MTIIAPNSEKVKYNTTSAVGMSNTTDIEPNQTVILTNEYDITRNYKITKPGEYSFQFINRKGLKSNIVKMEVKSE